ncbi:prepilin-type N-terminal cleavage/methylation domain-containing protein [candidate division KSB1 bacterium]
MKTLIKNTKCINLKSGKGFTLLELVVVIVILGVLATVAMRSFTAQEATRKFEETLREMDILKKALVGDEEVIQDGYRVDFGYVGDMGGWPPDFDALRVDPGIAGRLNWNGPYVSVDFIDNEEDYKYDAYNQPYVVQQLDLNGDLDLETYIRSDGAATSIIIADGETNIFNNTVRVFIRDRDGNVPTPGDETNIHVTLSTQNGDSYAGVVQAGGICEFLNNIPIGNHIISVSHDLLPGETPTRPVSVDPGSNRLIEVIFLSLP